MSTPRKSSQSNPKASSKQPRVMREATGALPTAENAQNTTAKVTEARSSAQPAPGVSAGHQADGSFTPITGPITSVRQLTRGPNVAKNSIGSFATMAAYGDYLRTLRPFELKRHALEEARIVPIDDMGRLIRRLEAKWTEISAKEGGRKGVNPLPQRQPFSAEQIAAQEKVRREMLGGRA